MLFSINRKTAVDPRHGRQVRDLSGVSTAAQFTKIGDNCLRCKHLRLNERTIPAASQPPFLGSNMSGPWPCGPPKGEADAAGWSAFSPILQLSAAWACAWRAPARQK